MRFILKLVVIAIAVFPPVAHAQAPIWYWCDTWQAYYPRVVSCPVPWRAVNGSTMSGPQPTAQPSATGEPTPLLPQASHQSAPTLGDGLDDWCGQVKLPSSIAICSDQELRALTLERQHAYDEAKVRLNGEQQKALLADQNGWVKSYAAACGLSQYASPALPLTPAVKECMAEAGRARIDYLRSYGTAAHPSATEATGPPDQVVTPSPSGAQPYEKQLVEHDNQPSIGGTITGLLVLLAVLYFLPTLIAASRRHHNAAAIFALNLLLGWTALGWIAALVWSLTAVNHPRRVSD